VPVVAGVTGGEVCCSFDGNGSSGLPCCDGPSGTVVLLSTSRPAFTRNGRYKDFRVPPQFGLFWQMAYIQSGTSPTSCFLCRRQRGIQPGNSLHLKIILYVWIPNTKRTNRIDSSGYLRPIIPIGSVDGSTAKQNLASAPCNINQHKVDQLLDKFHVHAEW
jgi:hypothetical protein